MRAIKSETYKKKKYKNKKIQWFGYVKEMKDEQVPRKMQEMITEGRRLKKGMCSGQR